MASSRAGHDGAELLLSRARLGLVGEPASGDMPPQLALGAGADPYLDAERRRARRRPRPPGADPRLSGRLVQLQRQHVLELGYLPAPFGQKREQRTGRRMRTSPGWAGLRAVV